MQNRRAVRGAFLHRTPIEIVDQDGFDRAVSPGADFDSTLRRSFYPLCAIGAGKPDDAST